MASSPTSWWISGSRRSEGARARSAHPSPPANPGRVGLQVGVAIEARDLIHQGGIIAGPVLLALSLVLWLAICRERMAKNLETQPLLMNN